MNDGLKMWQQTTRPTVK